uniref:HTH psq-type domain-containing protein n=1 Tax=Phytophthora ramorum TaxID=164328 RepID=H3GSY7_PHYRM
MSGTRTPRKQRAYSVREKRAAVRRIEEVGVEEVAREISCARGTVHGWWKQADKLFSFTGAATSKTLKGQGRKEMFPAVPALVTFMKDKRREEKALTTRGMMEYMWQIDAAWIDNYMVGKKSGLLALQRLVQRLAIR